MVSFNDRIFIIGGTGNVGSKTVKELLANNVRVTLFVRNPDKVKLLFSEKIDLIDTVQGDYQNLEPLKDALKGYSRLFVILGMTTTHVEIKKTIADYAYDAGIKQVIDLSSAAVNMSYRSSHWTSVHYYGEKAFYEHPKRTAKVVVLRPARFMTSALWMYRIKTSGVLQDAIDADYLQDWVSTEDLGLVAATILQDDINKHGESVYTLIGDVVSGSERAAVFSQVLGQDITYHEISATERFKQLTSSGLPFEFAVTLSDPLMHGDWQRVPPVIEILLGRKPQTFKNFIELNKDYIQ
ncbi:hypothetical protein EDC96DRAFT_497291 [Choanephora cucurbitarum]|nr:hypothetical protein EDC96DRAFT_497291 [Choanephora cucurbitarum]